MIQKKYERFLHAFTERNAYGMPSVVPVSSDCNALSTVFPIGHTLQYQEGITDVVTLSSVICNGSELYEKFGEDIADNLTYVNIKNRMKI